MSQANVDVVRRAVEAFSSRDLDTAIRDAHPDIEVDWSRSRGVEAGIYRGLEETRRFWSTFHETFDRITIVPEELLDHGDHVIMVDRTRFRGRDGIEVKARNVTCVTVRRGQIVRWRLCRDKAEALRVAEPAE